MLPFISPFASRDQVLQAVRRDGSQIAYARECFQADREIALIAVSQCGLALEHMPAFKSDAEVVLAATRQNGNAFQFADEGLLGHEEVGPELARLLGLESVQA